MNAVTSLITNLVHSTVYSGADQRKHQSSTSLAFVWEIHRWPVNSPYKGPITLKMFPVDYVIMDTEKMGSPGASQISTSKVGEYHQVGKIKW